MPRGPVRLAPGFVLTGSATVEYKRKTLEALADELQPPIDAGAATGFDAYAELDVLVDQLPQR